MPRLSASIPRRSFPVSRDAVCLVVWIALFVLLAFAVAPTLALAGEGPVYASKASREVVERMVAAHGGIDAFRRASAVQFDIRFNLKAGPDQWLPFEALVTADPRTRQVYATLPNPDGSEGRIAYDGRGAWSAGNLQGLARAPARMTAWRDLYLCTLPWMTQDAGVRLGEPERVPMPVGAGECIAVRMTFDAGTGDTPRDWYVLYIDPDSHRMRAAQYVMTYSALMQPGAEASPPSIFVWDETADVGGMVVPARYTVYWANDRSVVVKDGVVDRWAFDATFDRTRLEMPPDGQPDRSTP